MNEFNATQKKIARLEKLQSMMDNATYIRTWKMFTNKILDLKLSIWVK